MENTAVRIEGTMTTTPSRQQEIHVVKENATIPLATSNGIITMKTGLSKTRYETYKALCKVNGYTIANMTAELINRYVEEHIDEVLMLRNLRERL